MSYTVHDINDFLASTCLAGLSSGTMLHLTVLLTLILLDPYTCLVVLLMLSPVIEQY